ncbi:SCO family protein [Bosea sp. 47.2.35]|jgi:protein SCO1/2|uniref:SCO family protein n=1 Tax=Bosea sp. 47.2.35 TaxID=2969304 RepID=UPI0021505452|nr:SCO family protein [Bosea sp. 47.2.35]MCR4524463.1 SCO family protein [Bosea sp. 47.2.35]CAH1681035.1 putative Cytochrome oxidase biogenesis protein Sco1/SenC/PrrC, copper metallochaperone [Hyphomicrobiales bacterium]CAH1701599.1 putative Cytochrome oxidase biogenesis protein Sco1/SenC/PrrC, copper metallochaperone [Hyphomicrobiales bacterium]CAI0345766.1 protein SCO1 [Hyphomicrobiales bacterium]
MPFLKWIRYGAWAAVILISFTCAAILLGWWRVDGSRVTAESRSNISTPVDIGGPFSLTDHRGKAVTDKDFVGKPMAVFFGFTHCPEVCPTTLVQLGNLTKQIGQAADKLQILFITVDPERDTPEQMALYLESFDPRVVGLSGTREQVEAALKAYKAYAKKVPTDGSYTMDHTASVYLMNADGSFRTMIDYHEEDSSALAKIRMVLR